MSRHILLELLCIVLARKTVRIIPVGQKKNLHIHAFRQKHICTACGSMNTRFVTIVEEGNVVGETVKKMNLCFVKGCTRVRHHILYATLVHSKHIGIAFHHINHILLCYLFLGLKDAIEFVGFVVDERVW